MVDELKESARPLNKKLLEQLLEEQKKTNDWLEMIANQSASNGESLAQIVNHWIDATKHRVKESHWGKLSIAAVFAALMLGLVEIGDLGIIRDRGLVIINQLGIPL